MTVAELRNIFDAARPLVDDWLALSDQFAALRDVAKEKGFDWSQIKALLKARAQDERAGGGKHVERIIERAEFASSYAAMLGLGKMNEKNYSDEPDTSGESRERQRVVRVASPPSSKSEAPPMERPTLGPSGTAARYPGDDDPLGPDLPEYLRRTA